jgi:uncharacterized protein YhbP (UPF0306 family)
VTVVSGARSPELCARAVVEILDASRLLSLATVGSGGAAHINTAFFAFDPTFTLFVFTPPGTEHARNLVGNPSAAATVFDSHQALASRRGLQLFGEMRMLEGAEAVEAHGRFTERFADLRETAPRYDDVVDNLSSRFFALVPRRIKIFDEVLLDHGDFVEVQVAGVAPTERASAAGLVD